MNPCDGYSFWLAVEDVLPIIFGAIGFLALRRRIVASLPQLRRPVGIAVAALILGSVIAGPTRKAVIAAGADCEALGWMQIPFFVAIPIGFAVLAWALRCVLRDHVVAVWPWALVAAFGIVTAIALQRDVVLLAVGGLLAVATAVNAARLASHQGDPPTAGMFVGYAIATLSLPVVAGIEADDPGAALWAEQAVNTTAQLLWALAATRLARQSTTVR